MLAPPLFFGEITALYSLWGIRMGIGINDSKLKYCFNDRQL